MAKAAFMTATETAHKYHHIVDSYVYGPVSSRRYGTTLGINLSPKSTKHCNYDCPYCQLGWNKDHKTSAEFPSSQNIIQDLEKWFKEKLSTGTELKEPLDQIVLAGNGEPTLNPHFPEIIQALNEFKTKNHLKLPMACLTNGTTLTNNRISKALNAIEECSVKLDANPVKLSQCPGTLTVTQKLNAMSQLSNLTLQCCFFDGPIGNIDKLSVFQWASWIQQLAPKQIEIYTISRDTPNTDLKPISLESLTGIKELASSFTKATIRITS